VAVKSGRTSAGVRAASSHTAAISSGDTAVDALFRQTGVIRTDTLEELFDVATLLTTQGLPSGRKVAILTNAGGPGILAADALEANGLEVPPLTDRTIEQLRAFLPVEAGVGNPVDMIASASPTSYGQALEVLGHAEEVDILFVIFIPTSAVHIPDVAAALIEAKAKLPEDVPVVSVFLSSAGIPPELAAAQIPSFSFPEAAARAMGRVATVREWRRRPLGDIVEPDGLDRDRARQIVDAALAVTLRPATAGTARPVGCRRHGRSHATDADRRVRPPSAVVGDGAALAHLGRGRGGPATPTASRWPGRGS
jgi:acetate---CoA ligase (ADP-forming)